MDLVDYSYSRNYSAGVEDDFIRPMTPDGFSKMLLHYNLADYLYAPGPRGCHPVLGTIGLCTSGVFRKI